jgi:CBS domain containing-hemolysin-like protein
VYNGTRSQIVGYLMTKSLVKVDPSTEVCITLTNWHESELLQAISFSIIDHKCQRKRTSMGIYFFHSQFCFFKPQIGTLPLRPIPSVSNYTKLFTLLKNFRSGHSP